MVEADKGPKWGMVRAVVRGFDGQTHTATVQPVGSISTYLQAVPVSLEVTALEVGDRVLVMMLDEHNAGDAVVVCRY
ncbi:MAG: hypothetical protein HPY83_09900 [Anaerolineae bacterium]|nr:hypothetical protein [Anaerolineae bacterium]